MTAWIENLIEQLGYVGIALLMFLENIFPPIPSEVIMPLAGFTAGHGELSFTGVVLAGTIGTFLGAIPWYFLGRMIDEDRLRRWTYRYGRWITMGVRDLDRVDRWFDRSGVWAVFVGRVMPTIRTLISVPAGVFRMPLAKFLPATLAGSLIWNALLAYAGLKLEENYEAVEGYMGPVSVGILGLIVGIYLYRVITFDRDRV